MTLDEYFKEEPKGAIIEMATYLGVSSTWMSLLIHGHKVPSPKLAMKIERATSGLVSRKVLRPDIFLEQNFFGQGQVWTDPPYRKDESFTVLPHVPLVKATNESRFMATLTLKKSRASKPASDKPVNDLIDKFVVIRHSRSYKSFRFTCVHDTKDTAIIEAKRLVGVFPTERFLVLQVLEGYES